MYATVRDFPQTATSGPDGASAEWTAELVAAALAATWRVVQALEGEGPRRLRCLWPETAGERGDYPNEREGRRREPVSAGEIDLADRMLPALSAALGRRDRAAVAQRMAGRSWREIARHDGRSHTWLRSTVWPACLAKLGRHLGERGVAVPEWLVRRVEDEARKRALAAVVGR